MTTGAPGTAPDVSGVVRQARRYGDVRAMPERTREGSDHLLAKEDAVKQAAEQACYRYARSRLEDAVEWSRTDIECEIDRLSKLLGEVE